MQKSFQVEDLVWKTILPIGSKDNKFEKCSPNWEGPFKVVRIVPGNSYMLQYVQGEKMPCAINEKYLEKYYPSVWQDA